MSLGQNLTLKDRKLHIDLHKPLLFIEEIKLSERSVYEGLEPEKESINKPLLEKLWTENPSVLPD